MSSQGVSAQPPNALRILVIDDDPVAGEMLSDKLSGLGHTVIVTSSGPDGLREAEAQLPDLILLDVMMPGMDGFTTCAHLRAHPLTAEVPIVMITALGDRESRLRGIAAGADEFLTKPIDYTELRLRVQTMSKVNRYRRLVDERERTLAAARQAHDALQQAHDATLEASRLKSVFMTTFSHELRTPLVGIIGMSDLLLTTALDADQREYAQVVLSCGQDLLATVTTMLEYSSVEAGIWELKRASFDLAAVIQAEVDAHCAKAEAKGLKLWLTLGTGVALQVRGDADRLQMVLRKLLDNALKFTAQGQIQVTAAIVAATAAQVTVCCRVCDSGVGVAEEVRPHLFTAFYQADGTSTRQYGGLGVGLGLSKRIIEQMGGEIGFEPGDGQGSNFWFEVPFDVL